MFSRGFPGGSVVENPPTNARDAGFDPWVQKIPWRKKWQPTLVLLPRKSHGQRSLMATVRGIAKLDTTTKQQTTKVD